MSQEIVITVSEAVLGQLATNFNSEGCLKLEACGVTIKMGRESMDGSGTKIKLVANNFHLDGLTLRGPDGKETSIRKVFVRELTIKGEILPVVEGDRVVLFTQDQVEPAVVVEGKP